MQLRRLRYFVAVAESGSFSKAAQKIFLTQPALSRQIKALEDEVGVLLFERQAHSIHLTPAGEVLLQEARELLRHAEEVLERVRAFGRGVRLRVGYAPSLTRGLLSVAVENFMQKHQGARVELLDLSSREMLAGLESGTLDVALTVAPEHDTRGVRWVPLVELPWLVAISRQHPLAKLSRVTPKQLAGEPLLVFCQRDYPEYWDAITRWWGEQEGLGASPSIAGEYDGVTSLLAAVESRLGVALVTATAAELAPRRIVLKKLSSPPKAPLIAAGHRVDAMGAMGIGGEGAKPLAVFLEELRHAAAAALVSADAG